MLKFLLGAGILALPSGLAAGEQPEWKPFSAHEFRDLHALAIDGDTLWAGSDQGIQWTLDAGKTWSRSPDGVFDGAITLLAKAGGGLVAGRWNRLYLSLDGGRTWSARDSLETGSFFHLVGRNDTLLAFHAIFGGPRPDGVRISADGGRTWSKGPNPREPLPMGDPVLFNGDAYSISGDTVWREAGSEKSAALILPGGIRQVSASRGRLFALTVRGLCLWSGDGGDPWSVLETGIRQAEIQCLAAEGPSLAIQTPRAIYLRETAAREWRCLGPNRYLATFQQLHLSEGKLFVTSRSSRTAFRYDIGVSAWDSVTLPVAPVFFTAARGKMAFTDSSAGSRVYHSADNGKTIRDVPIQASPQGIFLTDHSTTLLWAGSNLYISNGWGGFNISQDSGKTWKILGALNTGFMTNFTARDSTLFATSRNGSVWRRTEEGASWDSVTSPLAISDFSVRDLESGPRIFGDGKTVYCGRPDSFFVWEEATVSRARHTLKEDRVHGRYPAAGFGLPVRAWPEERNGTGQWRDARGAVRHQF